MRVSACRGLSVGTHASSVRTEQEHMQSMPNNQIQWYYNICVKFDGDETPDSPAFATHILDSFRSIAAASATDCLIIIIFGKSFLEVQREFLSRNVKKKLNLCGPGRALRERALKKVHADGM